MRRIVLGLMFAYLAASAFVFLDAAGLQEFGQKQPKLGPGLSELNRAAEVSLTEAARLGLEHGLSLRDGSVRVVITIQPDSAREAYDLVGQLGGKVESSIDDLIRAIVPVGRLSELAASKAIRWIMPWRSLDITFNTVSEGVSVVGAPAWHRSGLTGQNVKIGVLDAGFRGYSSLLGQELPFLVTARSFRADGDISASDHGTAVAEIIHDVAPGASLYFTNYDGLDEVGYGQAVNWLIQQGVQVINSSTGFYCRGAQDGIGRINSAAREATRRGIFWANSSGNAAKHHWVGNFSDPDRTDWHNFDGSIEVNELELSAGDFIYACLSWDDWPASGLAYDFYLYDSSLNIVKSSLGAQSLTAPLPPFEEFTYQVPSSGKYYFAIRKYSATREPRMHIFVHFLQSGGCAAETMLQNQPQAENRLGLLRRFRDEVLTGSSFGQSLVGMYYRNSLEVIRILLLDSSLRSQALVLLEDLEPLLVSLFDSSRATFQAGISPELISRVESFADKLSAVGSEKLKNDIADIRSQADFQEARGLKPADYWARLKTISPPAYLESPSKPLKHRQANWSLVNPADSADIVAVGAVYHGDDSLEDYSSQGPTLDNRIKPDVMGPTRVCTVTRGNCGLGGFAGTSGSSPHIAGAAALVKQLKPGASPSDLETFIRIRTVDLLNLGPDNQSGWGRLNLGNAFVQTAPLASIDSPATGQTVSASVRLSGWAIHPEVGVGTGVDSVHVYLDGFAGQGQAVGVASYGIDRPDVANAFGNQRFRLSGYALDWNMAGLSPGNHTLYVYVHSSATDWSVFTRPFNKAAVGPVLLAIDWPRSNAVVSGIVRVAGWAIHSDAPSGPGVNAVHLYLDGPAGQGQGIAPANYGLDRPDVATAFGNQRFRFSGYALDWNTAGLSPGNHTLYVYVHSTLTGWSYFTWPIRK